MEVKAVCACHYICYRPNYQYVAKILLSPVFETFTRQWDRTEELASGGLKYRRSMKRKRDQ